MNDKPTYDIVTLGEILIDFTFRGFDADGQALFAQIPGGAPANVAVAASRLGARTTFVGKIGADMHGTFLRDVLEKEGVGAEGLLSDSEFFTTLAFVRVDENGERSFSFARKPGADTQLSKEELPLSVLEGSKLLHIGSLSLTDEPARSATYEAAARMRELGRIVSYDPNYRASLWKDEETAKAEMRRMIPYVDVMKLSDEETLLLTDLAEPEAAAAKLLLQGVKLAVVTLGGDGALVCTKEGSLRVPGFQSQVADTNGAGDCFWGAFLSKIACADMPVDEISLQDLGVFARFANAAASLCVEKKGAIPAMPRLSEVVIRAALR